MPAKKGARPPAAGKGRVKGKPNKVTRDVRAMFAAFVERNAPKAQVMFDRVAKNNPAKALEILTRFSDFVIPRLQRTEVDATLTQRQLFNGAQTTITDAVEAARVYQTLVGSLNIDTSNIHFDSTSKPAIPAPTPKPAAIPPPPKPKQDFLPAPEPVDERPPPFRSSLPPEPVEADDTVVAVVLEPLRHFHEHQPKPDSPCAGCRMLWVSQ